MFEQKFICIMLIKLRVSIQFFNPQRKTKVKKVKKKIIINFFSNLFTSNEKVFINNCKLAVHMY